LKIIKENSESMEFCDQDLADRIKTSIGACEFFYFRRKVVDPTDFEQGTVKILGWLPEWLSVEPSAPPAQLGLI
jgi:hypothetical protein